MEVVQRIGYTPALDGLRGTAIIAVMAFNGQLLWLQGGFIGVDIFFVLSGFLITALLIQGYQSAHGIGLRNFYFRRALRLLPAVFALMLFCIGYAFLFQSKEKLANTFNGVLLTLFYVANWGQSPPNQAGIGPLSHAWSLSVEEQFYIVWPLLLLLLLKLNSKSVIVAVLCFLAAISVLLNIWLWQSQVPFLRMYFGTDTRANELLIGCIAALLFSWGLISPARRWEWVFHSAALISLAGIVISFFRLSHYGPFPYNGGFALIAIGTAILILDLLLFPSAISRCFEFGPVVWIGKISYGLYLWHYPVFESLRQLFDGRVDPVFYKTAGVCISIMLAAGSFYFLEQPFLRLKNRYKTSDSTSLSLADSNRPAEST